MPAPTESVSSARALPWVVLTLLFLMSLPAVTPRLYASDEMSTSPTSDYFVAIFRSTRVPILLRRNIARAHSSNRRFSTSPRRRGFAGTSTHRVGADVDAFYVTADAAVRTARAFGAGGGRRVFAAYISAVAYGRRCTGSSRSCCPDRRPPHGGSDRRNACCRLFWHAAGVLQYSLRGLTRTRAFRSPRLSPPAAREAPLERRRCGSAGRTRRVDGDCARAGSVLAIGPMIDSSRWRWVGACEAGAVAG